MAFDAINAHGLPNQPLCGNLRPSCGDGAGGGLEVHVVSMNGLFLGAWKQPLERGV